MPRSTNSQHYQFAYMVIPSLFHHSSNEFIRYLETDRLNFLKFWWDHAGEETEESTRQPIDGMDYKFRDFKKGQRLVLLTLPPPRFAPEAYFLALIPAPVKKNFFPWKNLANVYALQYRGEKDQQVNTTFCAVTPRLILRDLDVTVGPDLEAFYQAVLTLP
jgi:hypothetical protein